MLRLIFFNTLIIFFFCLIPISRAHPLACSMELQNIYLPDAIRMIAKFLHLNVIISPSIKGTVTLNFYNAMPSDALDLLLVSQGLARWRVGNVWFIATQNELIKRKQDELKWQAIKDEAAPLITQLWLIKYAKAEEVAHLLQDEHTSLLSKRGRVRVDSRTNAIAIQDMAERIPHIRSWIDHLDVPVQQILIEARLLSVDDDCERELGVNFGVSHADTEFNQASQAKIPLSSTKLYSIAVAKLADGSLLDVKLSALESKGHAELISSPRLFTANQQPASIESGEEVPYQQVSDSGGTAVVFKKAVVGLKVTPQVLPGNKVLLQLQINQDRPNNKMVLGMPTISTRQITTNVLVKTGQTIVLGGIYETNKEKGEQGLPFINRLPLLGSLFKQQNTKENKRELLIFITPKIMTQDT